MWFYFNPNSEAEYNAFWHALKIFGFVLAYTNSCINPIALYCVSTSFRKHFNRLLCCCGADQGANGHHSGPVSYCGGSLCAGNAASYSRAGGTALLTEDPTAFTHHSSSRRQNTMLSSISRRHPQAENQKNVDGDYPLNELHRQLHQPTAVRTQSSCWFTEFDRSECIWFWFVDFDFHVFGQSNLAPWQFVRFLSYTFTQVPAHNLFSIGWQNCYSRNHVILSRAQNRSLFYYFCFSSLPLFIF